MSETEKRDASAKGEDASAKGEDAPGTGDGKEVPKAAESPAPKKKFNLKNLTKAAVMNDREEKGLEGEEWGRSIESAKTRNVFASAVRATLNEKVRSVFEHRSAVQGLSEKKKCSSFRTQGSSV